MKACFHIFATLALVFTGVAQARSLWDNMNRNQATGHVKMIAVDETQNEVFVKLEVIDENSEAHAETFKLCNRTAQGTPASLNQNETMELIRAAFQNNEKVQVGFGSSFDRCISFVSSAKGI